MAATHPEYDRFDMGKQSPSSAALASAALGGDHDEYGAGMVNDGEDAKRSEKIDLIVHDDDAFFKKYAVPVILGPFLPAIFAIIVIVSGEITLNTWTGSCGFNLEGKLLFHNGLRMCGFHVLKLSLSFEFVVVVALKDLSARQLQYATCFSWCTRGCSSEIR